MPALEAARGGPWVLEDCPSCLPGWSWSDGSGSARFSAASPVLGSCALGPHYPTEVREGGPFCLKGCVIDKAETRSPQLWSPKVTAEAGPQQRDAGQPARPQASPRRGSLEGRVLRGGGSRPSLEQDRLGSLLGKTSVRSHRPPQSLRGCASVLSPGARWAGGHLDVVATLTWPLGTAWSVSLRPWQRVAGVDRRPCSLLWLWVCAVPGRCLGIVCLG